MSNKTITVQTSPGLSLLTLLFIGLKLTGYISWSWLWVLAPSWIPLAFGLSLILFGLMLIGLSKVVK
jgi:hypothetical protein